MAKKPPTALYRKFIRDLVAKNRSAHVVEVGVYAGGLSRMIADLSCVKRLWLVDPWEGSEKWSQKMGHEKMMEVADSVIRWAQKTEKVEVLRMKSAEAVKSFDDESIDFFHTDGDHNTAMVQMDLEMWAPKVRIGGIISGDNFEDYRVSNGVYRVFDKVETGALGRVFWLPRSS